MSSTITALTSGGGIAVAGDTSGQLELKVNNGTTALTLTTAQKVGIGTTSPSTPLQVSVDGGAGNSAQLFRVTDTNTANGYGPATLTFGNLNHFAAAPTMAMAGTNGISFCIGDGSDLATQRKAMFDSSGNFLIDASSTQVSAKQLIQFFTGSNGLAIATPNNIASTDFTVFRANGATCGTISRVGTTSAVAYITTSDYRLKENVAPMTGALATVAQLKPVTYDWKSGGSSQGFIAHELQAIVPDCVTGQKDAVETVDDVDNEGKIIGTKEVPKYQGIDTSFLVATLTAAIQELKAELDSVKTELATLKA